MKHFFSDNQKNQIYEELSDSEDIDERQVINKMTFNISKTTLKISKIQ